GPLFDIGSTQVGCAHGNVDMKRMKQRRESLMVIARSSAGALMASGIIACYALLAQSQKKEQKFDTAVLVDAPIVPQMVVDSDGTLHFGPRTVPLPALASKEARDAYTRQMLQRAETSAGRGGLASVRTGEAIPAPLPGRSKERALKIYPVTEETN